MRILFAYFNGGGGGLSNIVLLLGAMARRFPQDQIDIVSSHSVDFSGLSGLENVSITKLNQAEVTEIGRLRFSLFGLRRLAVKLKSDVVWAMNLGMYVPCAIPQVLSINNAYQVYPLSTLKLHPAGLFAASVLRLFSSLSIRASQGVVVQSKVMRDQLRRLGVGVRKILVLPKSVESEEDVNWQPLPAETAALLSKAGGFDFLYVATGFPHKNHAVVIEAICRLRAAGKRFRLLLTMTPEDLRSMHGASVNELLYSGAVVPLGWVDKVHLRSLYESVDACVIPSLLESQSSAHLEAMAWQKPQISSSLDFAKDLCGEASLYANPYSSSEWAEAMCQLAGSADLRDDLVEKGKARMCELPQSWSHVAGEMRDFLHSATLSWKR